MGIVTIVRSDSRDIIKLTINTEAIAYIAHSGVHSAGEYFVSFIGKPDLMEVTAEEFERIEQTLNPKPMNIEVHPDHDEKLDRNSTYGSQLH